MRNQTQNPFESIEDAHRYVTLLVEALGETEIEVRGQMDAPDGADDRRIQALRLVLHKLNQLRNHLEASRRTLNDLRTLRRLMFEEREPRPSTESADCVEPAAFV